MTAIDEPGVSGSKFEPIGEYSLRLQQAESVLTTHCHQLAVAVLPAPHQCHLISPWHNVPAADRPVSFLMPLAPLGSIPSRVGGAPLHRHPLVA